MDFREKFTRQETKPAILVPLANVQKAIRNSDVLSYLKRSQPHSIVEAAPKPYTNTHKALVISSGIIPPEIQRIFDSLDATERIELTVSKSYKAFSFKEVLQELLPEDVVIPTSFETIGHIAHLNLTETQLPHRFRIAEVLLDKNPAIKTVVNKTHNLDSEFRACPVEFLAGEPKLQTIVVRKQGSRAVLQREARVRLFVDYANVFWNTRLSNEREWVVNFVPPHSTVCDVMAGVGGFGIMLVKKKNCVVHSNDLNPAAFSCMKKNIALNKIDPESFTPYNLDGRKFIETILLDRSGEPRPTGEPRLKLRRMGEPRLKLRRMGEPRPKLREHNIYFLMNLPAIAIEFLDTFNQADDLENVVIVCYCFQTTGTQPEAEIKARIAAVLSKWTADITVREVRDVAPNKLMFGVIIQNFAGLALELTD